MYLDSEQEREEYVLTQQGFIYQGSAKFIKGIPWNFGQVGPRPVPPNPLRPTVCQVLGLRQQSYKGESRSQSHPPEAVRDSRALKWPEDQRGPRPDLRSHSKGLPRPAWEQQPQIQDRRELGEPLGAVGLAGALGGRRGACKAVCQNNRQHGENADCVLAMS